MNLSHFDLQRLTDYYESALRNYGPQNPKALHWINEKSQLLRFSILSQIGDLNNASVLDVGSGLGDLYGYLTANFSNIRYTGIDIVPGMVAAACQKYPTAKFLHADIFSVTKTYDYILASGAFTFNIENGKNYYFATVKHMFEHARKGTGFNVLDAAYFRSDKDYLVYSKNDIEQLCENLTKNYKMVLDYSKGDITALLYP